MPCRQRGLLHGRRRQPARGQHQPDPRGGHRAGRGIQPVRAPGSRDTRPDGVLHRAPCASLPPRRIGSPTSPAPTPTTSTPCSTPASPPAAPPTAPSSAPASRSCAARWPPSSRVRSTSLIGSPASSTAGHAPLGEHRCGCRHPSRQGAVPRGTAPAHVEAGGERHAGHPRPPRRVHDAVRRLPRTLPPPRSPRNSHLADTGCPSRNRGTLSCLVGPGKGGRGGRRSTGCLWPPAMDMEARGPTSASRGARYGRCGALASLRCRTGIEAPSARAVAGPQPGQPGGAVPEVGVRGARADGERVPVGPRIAAEHPDVGAHAA